MITKLAFPAIVTTKVAVAFASSVIESKRPVVTIIVVVKGSKMAVAVIPITDNQFLARSSVPIATTWLSKMFRDWTTCLSFQAVKVCANSRKLAYSPRHYKSCNEYTEREDFCGVHIWTCVANFGYDAIVFLLIVKE